MAFPVCIAKQRRLPGITGNAEYLQEKLSLFYAKQNQRVQHCNLTIQLFFFVKEILIWCSFINRNNRDAMEVLKTLYEGARYEREHDILESLNEDVALIRHAYPKQFASHFRSVHQAEPLPPHLNSYGSLKRLMAYEIVYEK